jgi:ketol-acid reductoisomerase
MTIVYQETDADLQRLVSRKVAMVGYGNLGRSFALNLRDSGIQLTIGNNPDRYATLAENDGFTVKSIADVAAAADTLLLIIPDEVMPQLYLEQIAPHLRTGDMLVFASAYNVAYGFIEPPSYVDAALIAPRSLGVAVRDGYLNGLGYPAYVAVGQDYTGKTWNRLLSIALAVGALRQGAVEVSFEQEVELDLFFQQALLPAMHHMLLTAVDVLVNEGYPPEVVLTELYLSGELATLLGRAGVVGWSKALKLMSPTAQYGLFSRTLQFQEMKTKRQMESILDDIRRGDFAQEWNAEFRDGYPRLDLMRRRFENSPMWRNEQEVLNLLRGLQTGNEDGDFPFDE